ncbi:unnamed protein product, partial [Didymodactylos carnosus]
KWNPDGITVAGDATGLAGSSMNLLNDPYDIAIGLKQNLIIADRGNNRLQLVHLSANSPTNKFSIILTNVSALNVFVDRMNNIYFYNTHCDCVQKLLHDSKVVKTVAIGMKRNDFSIPTGIYVDQRGNLYVSDVKNHRVLKWLPNTPADSGIVVAGGNGEGEAANQLYDPRGLFVDEFSNEKGAIYVVDSSNHRVQKWLPDAREGVTVAGGNGKGSKLNQLQFPAAVIVDPKTNLLLVSDNQNQRIVKWLPNAKQGELIAGSNVGEDNARGSEAKMLNWPIGIRFDLQWNLYVADTNNNRIQKFLFNKLSCE